MEPGIRRQGREFALKVLYSLYDHDTEIDAILEDFWKNFRFLNDILGETDENEDARVHPHVKAFAEVLVRGVVDHLQEIDETVDQCSRNWALDRMPRVDLSLLRMAVYELKYQPDVPASVVMNEAIEIGKRYGSKDSPAFINGILDKVADRAKTAS